MRGAKSDLESARNVLILKWLLYDLLRMEVTVGVSGCGG
jgi:hypothetical protein